MSPFLEALSRVPDLLAAHLLLAASALVLGLLISLPLAIWSARRPAVARITLGFASLVQTIPSLALLALFYPLLLSLSALVGGGIPALGFLPSLLALTLYALLPILRNGVTGLLGLDPAVIEAADGVGMTAWQKLRLVEAPLVAPVLMAGIRTAAVWTIGAATLSTTVGQPSLGDMIFAGLQTQNWALVLAGCLTAAALALVVDALLGVIEHGIAARRRGRVLVAAGALIIGVLVALAPLWPRSGQTITIGAKGFSEQYILARLIGHRLERAGYHVQYREGLGSAVVFGALGAAISMSMSIIRARSGPTRCAAPMCPSGRRWCGRSATGQRRPMASACWARSGSRMPMPLRCAATMRSAAGSRRSTISSRPRRGSISAPISNFSNVPNGRR